ncbi:MAG TPA: alpha/beta family hydrolase [Polyangiaceae bacterium]|nr:alpha/beta family hydrolase [Polyangiaceae bacterium]
MENTTSVPSNMVYRDRHHAGVLLARELGSYASQHPLILAIARGGVPVAAALAAELDAELDVMVVQKLGVPGHPYITAGALSSRGASSINHKALGGFGISPVALDRVLDTQRLVLAQQEREIRGTGAPKSVEGRLVVVVDDAVMTGTTLHTAIAALRAAGARAIVLATPAGSDGALTSLRGEADDVVCPSVRSHLDSLNEVYENAAGVSVGYAREAYERFERERPRATNPRSPSLHRDVPIPAGNVKLAGTLAVPERATAVVVFLHGSGSNRFSSRNRHVAATLEQAGFATLLFDFLTAEEQAIDSVTRELGSDLALLANRAVAVLDWMATEPSTARLPVVLFGASSGAAAALLAVAQQPGRVSCVVSRGGRPDLAEAVLERISTPTLLLVGSEDHAVLELNREAARRLRGPHSLLVVPRASHLFAEPGTLDAVSDLTLAFLKEWLPAR